MNVVGTIRVLPNKNEKWIKYEYDKMMFKHHLCPFVCQADFECFCVKEFKNADGENEDNNTDTNTASSSTETPLHLQKNKAQTTRQIESNHAPNSYSIHSEVSEEYIAIANKNTLQLFYLHRDENEDAVESFIYHMIQIEEKVKGICRKDNE